MRELLTLPALADGVPEVLVGDTALDARVRWVHVSDSGGVARLLNGGELLLSTGSGWPTEPAELDAFVGGLVESGLAGLVLELGAHYRYVPAVVVDAARRRGLALVALHREVKFVAVTEAVHRRIIAEQTAALRARDEVRALFTALALRGSPADFVVHRLAQTLAAPIVLENLAHEIIAAEVPPGSEVELFTDWERRSRAAHRDRGASSAQPAGGWLIVPVEARGIRWGHLVALPGPAHAAGRASVLEQGAIALALGRLAEGEGDEWARIGRQRLLTDLLAGRFGTYEDAAARFGAAGFPVDGAQLVGVVATGAQVAIERADAAARALGARAFAAPVAPPLLGTDPAASGRGDRRADRGDPTAPAAAVLLSLPTSALVSDRMLRELARGLTVGDHDRLTLSVGTPGTGLEAGLTSLQEALALARTDGGTSAGVGRGPRVQRADDRPLVRLLSSLRDDHRLLQHGERMLSPLVEYDLARGGDLLDVLAATLAHPSNRTAAAAASHLSRSVFYQRIAQIQELLGADLDDGETQTALHLALLVRRGARG